MFNRRRSTLPARPVRSNVGGLHWHRHKASVLHRPAAGRMLLPVGRLSGSPSVPGAGAILLLALLASRAEAASLTAGTMAPLLLAKSWLLGYALVFLAILLGSLAVLIPAMRKSVRAKKTR